VTRTGISSLACLASIGFDVRKVGWLRCMDLGVDRVATNQPTSTLRLRLVGCLCNKASGWLVGQLQVRLVGWLMVQWPEAHKKVVLQKEVDFQRVCCYRALQLVFRLRGILSVVSPNKSCLPCSFSCSLVSDESSD